MQPIHRAEPSALSLTGLEKRLTENQSLFDQLKNNIQFQNILLLVPAEKVVKFVTGKISLEKCWEDDKAWQINLLVKVCPELLTENHGWSSSSVEHVIPTKVANELSAIFKDSFFEDKQKTELKVERFIEA